ncbi:MAG: biopolymer transporter ExbD [Rikenellaceae bacterium]|jgi:hypothetical protein|nr:biopolymer transporter ExbD [Rikenellaceae bacterium]
MAELNVPDPKGGGKKVRSKKMNAKVDLTAMVDLAFLLITFFMLTTTLQKPQSMNLAMPDKEKDAKGNDDKTNVAASRTLTLVLGTHNQLVYYKGQLKEPIIPPTVTGYGREGIRNVLIEQKRVVDQAMGNTDNMPDSLRKGLIVIIQPSEKSLYHNVVDALDEMAITSVDTYAIVDITPDDLKLLDEKGLN